MLEFKVREVLPNLEYLIMTRAHDPDRAEIEIASFSGDYWVIEPRVEREPTIGQAALDWLLHTDTPVQWKNELVQLLMEAVI